ncbi:putrescine transport ATP-binding protein PotA [Vibrio variabilis]|uniref:Putrescine transport ATP-binding protein PotA n=1 Tax=Vibrio variabilis TaxID=990271 RepID=A0ABQ0JHH9_9VIBR|nr:putrescine transport ATP-binding protein PotA [Vibrio variabilis]
MAELILNNVCKTYGQQDVVSNLNLEIPDGAFTALLGPSGCGKTTTLRMIAGLERLSRGMLTHGNRLLDDGQDFIGAEQRKMGMVFQSYALWPHMTVTENVAYPLKLQGIKGAALKNAVTKMLDLVALGPYAERRPDALSGGQRQRVALARCLIAEPEVVLLDEPLANLDRHLRATMEDTFRELHRRTGTTFVFVTHDQAEAMALASQIAVLKDGQLVQAGRPDEIYQKPQNRWVAEFIGKGSANAKSIID